MSLLHFRLHWYAISTVHLLLRRWQALALAIGVAAPDGVSLQTNLHS